MYIGFYSYHKLFNNNRLLTDPHAPIGDNLNYPFVLLAQKLQALGHKVSTIDLDDLSKFDAIIFVEFPGNNNSYFKKLVSQGFENLYLVLFESPIIKPDNYLPENHQHFKKVFTWDDNLIDNKKYFKINYSHFIPQDFNFKIEGRKKLCTLIASNKSGSNPQELYSERVNAIYWFEKNHPEDFDLYGSGWDRYNFQGSFLGINIARLNRLTPLTKLLRPYYPSYRGKIASKNITLQEYRFCICYENIKDITGYITEKIFDCFLAGCVPIYLGAQNITDHIPANTFIDKRKFNTYQALYAYLKNMPEAEYQSYLINIKAFLQSPKAYPFSAEYFANIVIENIV